MFSQSSVSHSVRGKGVYLWSTSFPGRGLSLVPGPSGGGAEYVQGVDMSGWGCLCLHFDGHCDSDVKCKQILKSKT